MRLYAGEPGNPSMPVGMLSSIAPGEVDIMGERGIKLVDKAEGDLVGLTRAGPRFKEETDNSGGRRFSFFGPADVSS